MMIPAAFERVRGTSFARSVCSPEPERSFRGLLLAAPTRITLAGDTPFPVCGSFQVGGVFLNRFYSMANEIVVVAVDAATHRPHACNLIAPGVIPEPSGYDPSAPGFDSVVMGGYYNLDLFKWMPDLPRRAARYHLFSTIGEVISNVLATELVEP